MLYNKKVPISESALLVIDAQDSFKVGLDGSAVTTKTSRQMSADWLSFIVSMVCP